MLMMVEFMFGEKIRFDLLLDVHTTLQGGGGSVTI